MKIYKERTRFYSGAPIDVIGSHIEALKEGRPEGITAADVVEDAANPDSPIHPCFLWDDSKAGPMYRMVQARRLMTCYEVRIISQNSHVVISPASVRILNSDKKPTYVSTHLAMSDDQNKKFVLQEARILLAGVRKRLSILESLSPVILEKINELEKAIDAEMNPPQPEPKQPPRPHKKPRLQAQR